MRALEIYLLLRFLKAGPVKLILTGFGGFNRFYPAEDAVSFLASEISFYIFRRDGDASYIGGPRYMLIIGRNLSYLLRDSIGRQIRLAQYNHNSSVYLLH